MEVWVGAVARQIAAQAPKKSKVTKTDLEYYLTISCEYLVKKLGNFNSQEFREYVEMVRNSS